MENNLIQTMRKLIPSLPEKDVALGNKFLANRNFEELQNLVDSAIAKVKKDRTSPSSKYKHIDIDNLHKLSGIVSDYSSQL